jgi:uncharacterized membrane protein YpjA
MPIGSTHRTKFAKNFLLLGLLITLVAGVYGVAYYRVQLANKAAAAEIER